MQRNWIGRSEGAQFAFEVVEGSAASGERIEVYTTRPDTIFGATYVVIAPEHPLALKLASDAQRQAVAAYVEAASRKSDLERTELAKNKTGVWTGSHVRNPATGEAVPVWVAGACAAGFLRGMRARVHHRCRADAVPRRLCVGRVRQWRNHGCACARPA